MNASESCLEIYPGTIFSLFGWGSAARWKHCAGRASCPSSGAGSSRWSQCLRYYSSIPSELQPRDKRPPGDSWLLCWSCWHCGGSWTLMRCLHSGLSLCPKQAVHTAPPRLCASCFLFPSSLLAFEAQCKHSPQKVPPLPCSIAKHFPF